MRKHDVLRHHVPREEKRLTLQVRLAVVAAAMVLSPVLARLTGRGDIAGDLATAGANLVALLALFVKLK